MAYHRVSRIRLLLQPRLKVVSVLRSIHGILTDAVNIQPLTVLDLAMFKLDAGVTNNARDDLIGSGTSIDETFDGLTQVTRTNYFGSVLTTSIEQEVFIFATPLSSCCWSQQNSYSSHQ